jgi:hypothetical protein
MWRLTCYSQIHATDTTKHMNNEIAVNRGSIVHTPTSHTCSHTQAGPIGYDDTLNESVDNCPTQDFAYSINHTNVIIDPSSQESIDSIVTHSIPVRMSESLIQRNKSLAGVSEKHPVLTVEEARQMLRGMHECLRLGRI